MLKNKALATATWLALLLVCGSGAMFGACVDLVTVDENGNGSVSGCTNMTIQGTQSGGGPLIYSLSFLTSLQSGDLILQEPVVGTAAVNSDVIRFFTDGPFALQFFSDNAEGTEDLADVGLPTVFASPNVTVTEVGAEGSNGFTWAPTTGQPGAAGVQVTYQIVSDNAAPEPSTMLLALPAAGLIWMRRRRVRG